MFIKYIKKKIKTVYLFAVCILLFVVIFALYSIPIAAVMYPAVLCIVLAGIFASVDYIKFVKKHKLFEKLKKLPDDLGDVLEDLTDPVDEDYREIIKELLEKDISSKQEFRLKLSETVDYYTMWVHQIKTPIASMRLALQNEDSRLSRQLTDDLFRIEQYVEMVLTYLRLDSDSTDYVFRPCSVDALIKSVLRKLAGQFINSSVRLDYRGADIDIVTDEKWLAFVFEQVLTNALKYTKNGSVSIYIDEAQNLCFEDTGIGIDAQDLPRIFEKGYTGYNGRMDKKASGIGLYLCKRICDKLGHDISVSSAVGKGTTVRISLGQKKTTAE